MVQGGTRGGVSSIMHRLSVANNKYVGDDYDPTKECIFIPYLDANNLYGYAMSQLLPKGGFKWMTESELEDWKNIPCFLEIDCEYPRILHDSHNDYPLAPECLVLNKVPKLAPNLKNKNNYVAHYRAIKFLESKGLKITKIHRGIKFTESAWMKKYIDLNTQL
jgi:hypothetical protein